MFCHVGPLLYISTLIPAWIGKHIRYKMGGGGGGGGGGELLIHSQTSQTMKLTEK